MVRHTSSLVLAWVLKQPNMVEVTVVAPGFWTPRIVMHMCLPISFASEPRVNKLTELP